MSAASRGRHVSLVVPGSIDTRTGGYGYDREIVAGLQRRGWTVEVHEIPGTFPFPSAGARTTAAAMLASIPAGARVIVDGLALGALPDEASREAARLRLVALVHHPLADETGLTPDARASLEASERRALQATRHVVVTSPLTARALDRFGVPPPSITVIEPGTDPAPQARGSNGGVVELLCVATVVPQLLIPMAADLADPASTGQRSVSDAVRSASEHSAAVIRQRMVSGPKDSPSTVTVAPSIRLVHSPR